MKVVSWNLSQSELWAFPSLTNNVFDEESKEMCSEIFLCFQPRKYLFCRLFIDLYRKHSLAGRILHCEVKEKTRRNVTFIFLMDLLFCDRSYGSKVSSLQEETKNSQEMTVLHTRLWSCLTFLCTKSTYPFLL